MNRINDVISGYQQRIGKYDKHVWEQTIEQEVLKRLRSVPRKTAKVNTDLIDVDLFRGSAFSASKPNHGWVAILRMALLRTIFLPFYFRWWKSCTGVWLFSVLCLLYFFQIITMFIFLDNSEEEKGVALQALSSAHVFCPCVMMFVLALIHTQMMSVAEFSPQYSRVRPSNRRDSSKKHSKSASNRASTERERDSGGSHDTGIDLNPEDVGVRGSTRHQSDSVREGFRKPRNTPPADDIHSDTEKDCHDDTPTSVSGAGLTSDVASAFEKTSDWVRNLSPNQCELPESSDRFDHLSGVPVSADDSHLNLTSQSRVVRNQSSVSLNLQEVADSYDLNVGVADVETSTLQQLDKNCRDTNSMQRVPVDSSDAVLDQSDLPLPLGEPGKVTETESVENSHGSLSDVAESSLLFCSNDIILRSENEAEHVSSPWRADESVGVRLRKKTAVQESQAPDDQRNKIRLNSTKTVPSRPFGLPIPSSVRAGLNVPKGFMQNEKPSGWRAKSFVSSEEELEKGGHTSSCRAASSRKTSVNQSSKSLDKSFSRNTPETTSSKHGTSRGDNRSQPKVKIIDTRQMESTGISSCDSDGEDRMCKGKSSPKVPVSEWDDMINTNTEMTSPTDTSSAGSSASDLSEKDLMGNSGESVQGIQHASAVMNNLASNTDRVSCMIWEPSSVHKVDMTVMDIGWMIIQRVDKMNETLDYLILGFIFSLLLMFTPVIYRGYHSRDQLENLRYLEIEDLLLASRISFGQNWRQVVVIINGMFQRLFLSLMFFFLLSVAERTFKQRLLYAKNFCYLTSSRRAKKYELPHFRLNKVRNIKTWLSLRCFLKKRGPQRTVDSIVSAAFLLSVILLSILCIELLQDYGNFLDHLSNWELILWCLSIGIYLLRFMTLGTKINKKYRNFSVLITEQINLYLHMEQKPHKKDELMVANSVLKLAEDLLKELESPFKISGLSANPFLYNITKVVVLSAFSAVLTELLGFKLKLYKIKIRS